MARVLVNDESLTAIADAIREKLDVETTYLPSQMAEAIEGIPTGTSLTSADEGKVVVESSGDYVLQSQTSRNISQNGTYDTTTNDEVVVSVSGGGSTNILSGTTVPTAQDGTDGTIFILTVVSGRYDSDFPTSKLSLSEWTKNGAAFTRFVNSYNSATDENTLDHTGGTGYERVYVSVPVDANTDYIFELDYYSPSGVSNGYSGQINMAASVADNISASGTISSKIGYTNLSTSAQSDYSHYTLQFNSGSNVAVYLVIDLNIIDGKNCILKFKNFSFHKVGVTPQYVGAEVVDSVYLKVNGAWVPIEGQDINDVNL